MDKLRTYLALLTVYENNFRILHWKACGLEFYRAHKQMGGYYEEFGNYIDEVAEQMLSLGQDPVCAGEALKILNEESDISAITIDPTLNYSMTTAFNAAYIMMDQAHTMAVDIVEDTDDYPPDVIDIVLKQADYFRLECLYKMKRLMTACDETAVSTPTVIVNHDTTVVTDSDDDEDND